MVTYMTIKDAIDQAAVHGKFSHFMNEFAHGFLWDADFSLVKDAPADYESVGHDNYVYAACFVHYWCDVLLMPIPEWVFLEKYRKCCLTCRATGLTPPVPFLSQAK